MPESETPERISVTRLSRRSVFLWTILWLMVFTIFCSGFFGVDARYGKLRFNLLCGRVWATILETDLWVPLQIDTQRIGPRWDWGFQTSGDSYLIMPDNSLAKAHSVVVPLWPVALACLILVLRARRRTESLHPKCGSCGYDITGNFSGRCPECGTATTQNRG
ncbi:MAG: hypothetical protein AMXMBFR47_01750 [Planctomycetota bacterium]